jgi:hypothetical protein
MLGADILVEWVFWFFGLEVGLIEIERVCEWWMMEREVTRLGGLNTASGVDDVMPAATGVDDV